MLTNDMISKFESDKLELIKKYPHLFNADGEFIEDADIEDVCIVDTSSKQGYNLPIPIAPELLGDKEIDYKLIFIMAYLCNTDFNGMTAKGKPDLRRYITKDVLNRVARKLYGRARDTFNKKLKVLKDKKIFVPDKVDKEQLNYNYQNVGQFITVDDISMVTPLLMGDDIPENTFRIYCHMLKCCREYKLMDYDTIVKAIGLKNLNRGVVKELIKHLLDLELVYRYQKIEEKGKGKIEIKNYFRVEQKTD